MLICFSFLCDFMVNGLPLLSFSSHGSLPVFCFVLCFVFCRRCCFFIFIYIFFPLCEKDLVWPFKYNFFYFDAS